MHPQEAIMACGIDSPPGAEVMATITKLPGVQEALIFNETN